MQLVQTGKALRASRKDGQGNVAQAHGSLQPKLPETIRTFHSALDDLENDIVSCASFALITLWGGCFFFLTRTTDQSQVDSSSRPQ